MLTYKLEPNLSTTEFIDVLVRSTLAERRPVDRFDVMTGMLKHADLIVTARIDKLLVGVSRAITDYSYCKYLSDLGGRPSIPRSRDWPRTPSSDSRGSGFAHTPCTRRCAQGSNLLPAHWYGAT
jgi:hypothetical protein